MEIILGVIGIIIIGIVIGLSSRAQKIADVKPITFYPFAKIGFLYGIIPVFPWFARNTESRSFYVMFTEKSKYDHGDDNNHDWNKGGGESYDLLSNHIDAFMWGWRYNQVKNLVEVCLYCHVNGNRVIYKKNGSEVLMEIPLNKLTYISFRRSPVTKTYRMAVSYDDSISEAELPYTHDKRSRKTIAPYFGGDQTPPNKLTIHYQKN